MSLLTPRIPILLLPASSCCCLLPLAAACFLLLLCCCLLPPAAAAASSSCCCYCRWCKHFVEKENNSLGRLVWRWREVRAGDTSTERECFWLVGMKHCGRIARLFCCVHHLHQVTPSRKTAQTARRRKTAQHGTKRRKAEHTTDDADEAPTKPASLSAGNGTKGLIPTRKRWVDRT